MTQRDESESRACIGPLAGVEIATPSGLWPEPGSFAAVAEVYKGGIVRVFITDKRAGRPGALVKR